MSSFFSTDSTVAPGARLDRLIGGWRGPLLSALLVLLTALPGLIFLPPLDRDESRFAQATAQMLETHDFVNIRYQAEPRDKKPVGIHWLQAASVSALSSVERREIWAYRVPSLLGAMLAAAACAWGAGAYFGPRGGLVAGLALGASLLLSSEAFIAKTDAVLCGSTTLAMAALGRMYLAARENRKLDLLERLLFWSGLAVSVLDKGPIGPMVVGLALAWLMIADRKARWIGRLSWGWGLLLVLAIVGPWALAITVSTDGAFWTGAVGHDLAPKLVGGHESHGAPFGLHALLAPLLMFPATPLLPVALAAAWVRRRETGVRFAIAWLIPTWFVFEALPTKLVHYPLPAYGALAWLMAAALTAPESMAWNRWTRWIGAGLACLVSIALSVALVVLAPKYGVGGSAWVWLSAALVLATGLGGAFALAGPKMSRIERWQVGAGVLGLGVAAHMTLTGGLAPTLRTLWVSQAAADLIATRDLDPRNGVTPGPVAVVGYAEPSLVFLLGTFTELDTPQDAADAVADGEPAIVERKQDGAFQQALRAAGVKATAVGEIKGLDYSIGKPADLRLYRSDAPPPKIEVDKPPPPPESSKTVAPKTANRPAP
jgi:4-amino-4-deoxy-L-arabinose transferase-like glycosyltransferase